MQPQANLKTSVQLEQEQLEAIVINISDLLSPSASAAPRGQEFATGVHPAGARLSVLCIRVMTAPTLGPSTCTLVRQQMYAHEN